MKMKYWISFLFTDSEESIIGNWLTGHCRNGNIAYKARALVWKAKGQGSIPVLPPYFSDQYSVTS